MNNALNILKYLSERRSPVTANMLIRSLNLPRSSTYELLSTLSHHGFVVHFPEKHLYGLGTAAFMLGSAYSAQQPLTLLGQPLLDRLTDKLRESSHLTVLRGSDVVYLVEARAWNRPSLVTDVGVTLPSSVTASGRAMLSCLSREQVNAMFPTPQHLPVRHPNRSPRTLKQLLETLRTDQARGFAFEMSEVTSSLASIAVPIVNALGWPVASIAVTFKPSSNEVALDRAREDFLPDLIATSAELSRRVQGR
ncbi:IclR family transcriptional regulator [Pseudoclavibacter sp. CFCC 11306]|uniref:IclR family transcriptional regulator n=1 Tax=Pseudoclavibacter sp. CFCC 11306 TaxID=1564493 RepID=UPI001CE49096